MADKTEELLGEILATMKSLDSRISRLESSIPGSASVSGPPSGEKKLSLKEFLIDRQPSNAVQMTLAIAYFLENYDGVSPVNTADIERGFRAAREAVPANVNDKANMCVKNGYFMEHNEKKDSMKAWLVTRTGEEIVRAGFSKTRT
jgi:hypothetical protein